MDRHFTKDEIFEKVRAGSVFLLEATLSKLSRNDMTKPVLENGWTVKDIVAHIFSWEQLMVKWINNALNEETPTRPSPNG